MNLNVAVQEYAYEFDFKVPQQTRTVISHVIASLLRRSALWSVRPAASSHLIRIQYSCS